VTKKYTLSAQSLAVTYTAQSLAFAIKTADAVGGTSIAASNLRFAFEEGFFMQFLALLDNYAVSDSEVRAFFKSATDSFSLADAATAAFVKARADTAATADEVVFATFKALVDTALATDALATSFAKFPSDVINATDDVDGEASIEDDQEIQYFKTRTNIGLFSDGETFDTGKSLTDQPYISEEVVTQIAYLRSFADNYAISDLLIATALAKPESDSFAVSETLNSRGTAKHVVHELYDDETRWYDAFETGVDPSKIVVQAAEGMLANINDPPDVHEHNNHRLIRWLRTPNPDTGRAWGDWLDDGEIDKDTVDGGAPTGDWMASVYLVIVHIWGRIKVGGSVDEIEDSPYPGLRDYIRDVFLPNYPHAFAGENHAASTAKPLLESPTAADLHASNFATSRAEAPTVTDSFFQVLRRNRAFSDAPSATDAVNSRAFIKLLSDTHTAVDDYASGFATSRTDNSTAQDAYAAAATKSFFETATSADLFARQVDYVRAFTDTATVTDDLDGEASTLDDQEMQFVKDRTDVASVIEAKSLEPGKVLLETPAITDVGSLRNQGFVDFTYFAEDFVGASRTFD